MGFIGFAVKLVHIPINNILVCSRMGEKLIVGWKKLGGEARVTECASEHQCAKKRAGDEHLLVCIIQSVRIKIRFESLIV